jgi:uncharacterized membrane protein
LRKNKKKKGKKKISHLPANHNNQPINQNDIASKDGHRIVARAQTVSFSGPLPPPELLAQYDQIVTNGADRILKMAENQSTHRHCIEKWAVIGGTALAYVGVFAALAISLCVLYFSYMLMSAGHAIAGTILSGGSLGGLVYSFIYGTRSRREERLQKEQRSKVRASE